MTAEELETVDVAVLGLPVVEPGRRDSTEVIHGRLRTLILRGVLPAGAGLSQAQVAKDCGVSRAPVREAFRLLQREGLLDVEVNQRARVAPLSLDDVEHVYALRVVNEALAIAVSVPRFSPEELDDLDQCADAVAAAEGATFDVWERHHQRFHAMLVMHAGEGLRRSLAQWAEHTERYRRVYVADSTGGWTVGAREHAQMAAACRDGDAATVAALLARHLSRAALTLVATMDPRHDPALLRAAVRQVVGSVDTPITTASRARRRPAPDVLG